MTALSPAGSQRPFRMIAGVSSIFDLADGYLGLGNFAVGAKDVYFVDGNCGGTGASGQGGWHNALKTLAAAITLSNTSIAANSFGWASRNVIFVRGDTITENLTVLPNKCDIIGCGSYDETPTVGIRGIHPIGSGAYMGTRFINCFFDTAGAGGNIFTFPATTSGVSFLNCTFDGKGSTKAGSAIVASGLCQLTVKDCRFIGAFTDSVIELLTGEFNDLLIQGNIVQGADEGIEVVAATTSEGGGYIIDNYVNTTGVGIRDTSGIMNIINNRVITTTALGAAGTGAIVDGVGKSLGNLATQSSIENAVVPPYGTLT
jgi:hypothetical protein